MQPYRILTASGLIGALVALWALVVAPTGAARVGAVVLIAACAAAAVVGVRRSRRGG